MKQNYTWGVEIRHSSIGALTGIKCKSWQKKDAEDMRDKLIRFNMVMSKLKYKKDNDLLSYTKTFRCSVRKYQCIK